MEHNNQNDGPKHENHLAMTEVEYKHHKSDVWKTTILLSIVTIVEVVFAIYYERSLIPDHGAPLWLLRLFLIVMSLLKAAYIMAVFMHVKHERFGFIMTITIPFTLFIWMIIAFLYEGNDWNRVNGDRFGEKPNASVIDEHKGVEAHH